jgi:hypothetical protein
MTAQEMAAAPDPPVSEVQKAVFRSHVAGELVCVGERLGEMPPEVSNTLSMQVDVLISGLKAVRIEVGLLLLLLLLFWQFTHTKHTPHSLRFFSCQSSPF